MLQESLPFGTDEEKPTPFWYHESQCFFSCLIRQGYVRLKPGWTLHCGDGRWYLGRWPCCTKHQDLGRQQKFQISQRRRDERGRRGSWAWSRVCWSAGAVNGWRENGLLTVYCPRTGNLALGSCCFCCCCCCPHCWCRERCCLFHSCWLWSTDDRGLWSRVMEKHWFCP